MVKAVSVARETVLPRRLLLVLHHWPLLFSAGRWCRWRGRWDGLLLLLGLRLLLLLPVICRGALYPASPDVSIMRIRAAFS